MNFTNQIGVRLYCVRNENGDYWCNDWGWIEMADAEKESPFSVFTEQEKERFILPVGEGAFWEVL